MSISTEPLIERYRKGLGAINLICLKIKAEDDEAQRFGKNISLTLEDRGEIVESIITLSDDLNAIIESDSMRSILIDHLELADKVYLKMYGEREGHGPAEIWSYEEEFIRWIRPIPSYIEDVSKELDNVLKYETSECFQQGCNESKYKYEIGERISLPIHNLSNAHFTLWITIDPPPITVDGSASSETPISLS